MEWIKGLGLIHKDGIFTVLKNKYTNLVRNFCKQKKRPLPEFPGVLCNVLGHAHTSLHISDLLRRKRKDQETAKPNKAISWPNCNTMMISDH